MLCIHFASRAVWITVDPLRFNEKVDFLFDRWLFEGSYPLLFTIMAAVLLLWSAMYQFVVK